MSEFPKPYHLADETIEDLNRKAVRRVDQTKQRLITLKFDELNVLQEIDSLYAGLELDNRRALRKLFRDRYIELWLWLKGTKYGGNLRGNEPDEDILDELIDMALAGLLDEPNSVTRYTYSTEVIRKRDRAKEAVNSAPTKAQKQLELDKALRYWSSQTGFYVDLCEDEATIQVYKDAGVRKGLWNSQGDGKVCSDCHDLDGQIFSIENIPDKPHPRCRCYITPAKS